MLILLLSLQSSSFHLAGERVGVLLLRHMLVLAVVRTTLWASYHCSSSSARVTSENSVACFSNPADFWSHASAFTEDYFLTSFQSQAAVQCSRRQCSEVQ